jgi:hypothetical protein
MVFIKFIHSTGEEYLNIERVDRFNTISPTSISIYFTNNSPITYSFSSEKELLDFIDKLSRLVKVIDI